MTATEARAIAHGTDHAAAPGPAGPVAHVASHYGLPSETFIVDAVHELDRLGWRAWVLAWSARLGPETFPPADRVLVPPAIGRLRKLRDLARGRMGGDRFAAALWPRIAPQHPVLAHAHFGWAGVQALPLVRRLGVPLVVTFHATDITVWPRRRALLGLQRNDYGALFAEMERAIVVSEYMRDELRALDYGGRIDVLPPGVRLEHFRLREALPPVEDELRLVFVGRLVRRKGLDVLLRALPAVIAADRRVRLEVLGDGEDRAECERLALELGVADRVRFQGTSSRAQVIAALHDAHVFVVPSRRMPDGEVEGSPVVTKEALAIGVPLVATRNGGLPETVPPNRRHELVAEDDPEALGAAIVAMLEARDEWPERAREGRAWIEERFDWRRIAEATGELYAETVER